MTETDNTKRYDLEDRTLKYTRAVIGFTDVIPKTIVNQEIIKQLFRSSSSIGANYIEANGALGKKDFIMRIRICRKETKESHYWLNLISTKDELLEKQKQSLINETIELLRIFNTILNNVKI